MQKNISEWQKEFSDACLEKFPTRGEWTEQDSLLSIGRQLADLTLACHIHKGLYEDKNGKKENPDWTPKNRVAALVADVLIFCEQNNIDWQSRLPNILDWYLDKDSSTSK